MTIQQQLDHALAIHAKIEQLSALEYECRTSGLKRLEFLAQNALVDAQNELRDFNKLAVTTLLPK